MSLLKLAALIIVSCIWGFLSYLAGTIGGVYGSVRVDLIRLPFFIVLSVFGPILPIPQQPGQLPDSINVVALLVLPLGSWIVAALIIIATWKLIKWIRATIANRA